MSDKYLLAMVLVYFRRAGLSEREYTCVNFFSALLLANKMEEEQIWYRTIYSYVARFIPLKMFLKNTDTLWNRLQLRTLVTLEQCEKIDMKSTHYVTQKAVQEVFLRKDWDTAEIEAAVVENQEVMRAEDHWAWQRKRKDHHGEAIRRYARNPCHLCNPPQPLNFPFAYSRVTSYYKNISGIPIKNNRN